MPLESVVRSRWTVRLLAVSLLLGGLRDPRLFAVGGAMVWALVWVERPPLGAAASWLPWLGWAAFSALSGASPLSGVPVLARWATALGFASLAASWGAEEREEWLKTLGAAAVVLVAAAVWTGARVHFRAAMTGLIPPYYNYTVFAVSALGAAAAAWMLHPSSSRGRAAAWLVAASAAVMLILSRSRGGALGLAFAAVVWAGRRWGWRRALGGAALALAAGGAIAVVGGAAHGLLDKGRLRGEARPAIWRAAVRVASESPWLGEGPGNFGAGFRRAPAAVPGAGARWGLSTDYAHSEPLQAAAETGWAGLALWLAAMAGALSVLFRRADHEPAREAAAAAAAAMGAQLLVDNMLQVPALAMLFFSALAVAGSRRTGSRRWPRGAALAAGLVVAAAWIPRGLADADPARAARWFPTDPSPVEDLAYRAAEEGKTDEADALWARAESLAPFDAVYPWRRAQIAQARGDWAAVLRRSERALAREPGFLRARLLRAEALSRLGRGEEARAELDEIVARRSAPQAPSENGYERTVAGFDEENLRLSKILNKNICLRAKKL